MIAVFDLSLMSVTRALNELTAQKLCERTGTRKKTIYSFNQNPQDLWDKAVKLMRSPIQKKLWVNQMPAGVPAYASGLDALSKYSDIAAGNERTFAVSRNTAKTILNTPGVQQLPYAEDSAAEIEIWRYNPEFTARGEIVDPRSLYLIYINDPDERISMAIERMSKQW